MIFKLPIFNIMVCENFLSDESNIGDVRLYIKQKNTTGFSTVMCEKFSACKLHFYNLFNDIKREFMYICLYGYPIYSTYHAIICVARANRKNCSPTLRTEGEWFCNKLSCILKNGLLSRLYDPYLYMTLYTIIHFTINLYIYMGECRLLPVQ